MVKNNNPSPFFTLLYILIIISMTFPIATSVPLLRRPWFFAVVGVILGIGYIYRWGRNKVFLWLFLYAFVVFLNYIIGDVYFNDFLKVFFEITYLFVPVVLFIYISDDIDRFRLISIVFIILLVECAIVSIIADNNFPGIMRLQSNDSTISEEIGTITVFQKYGMSNYLLPHALPTIIPALIYCIKKNKKVYKIQILSIILLISVCAIIYVSNSATAILLSFFVLLVSLFINLKKKNKTIIVLFVLLVPIILIPSFQNTVLYSLLSLSSNNDLLNYRMNDIILGIEKGESVGDLAVRGQLYSISTNSFIESISFGTNSASYGGHSAILDRLATLGLFGIVPLFIYVFLIIRYTIKIIPSDSKQFYSIGVLSAIIMLLMKNMSNWPFWFALFVLLPGGLLICQHTYNKVTSKSKN